MRGTSAVLNKKYHLAWNDNLYTLANNHHSSVGPSDRSMALSWTTRANQSSQLIFSLDWYSTVHPILL